MSRSEPLPNGDDASRITTNGSTVDTTEYHGLRIIIIGAGIGGLTAAIFLRKQGHRVTLLEQSRFANEVGAAMHLAPNANGLLRRINIYAENIGANAFERVSDI
jgi:2-polyprenyl-6-methoxyphenol hydroxylase-like FAD-dependent oxidoreductase